MAGIRRAGRQPDFRAFRKPLRLYFCSLMSPQAHASSENLQTGARVALFGMVVNFIFATAKIIGGLLGNAYVLIADGIESALDIAGSLVIWGGLKFAARPPDETHPYGHGKAEPIAAIVVALGVLAAATGLAIESVREILTPHHGPAPFTLAILVVVIVVKEILFRYVSRVGHSVESTAVQTDAWHHRSDALTSAAAFIGISVALIGGEGWQSADDWAALFACAVIAANGYRIARPAFFEIMDTAPRGKFIRSITRTALSVPGVIEVEKCHARKMGLDFYVDLHVGVDGNISVHEGHEIAHRVKSAIQQSDSRIADVLVHIEPAKTNL
jgi:cation diffusion facilitator family transporter